jgi:hypothetical protein
LAAIAERHHLKTIQNTKNMVSQLLLEIENALHDNRTLEIIDSEKQYEDFQNDPFLKDMATLSTGTRGHFIEIKPVGSGFIQLYISVNWATDSEVIFKVIANSECSAIIKSIRFIHKGGQTNGTVELYFNELLSYNSFPNLTFFYTQHFSEDGSLIASFRGNYDEDGLGGKILDFMPNVKVLNLVSAPDDTFFNREHHPVETLEVRAGYENNKFIENLTDSKCFPNLKHFSYQDINITFTQSPDDSVMRFETIEKFMESKNFPNLEVLSLLELKITDEQIEKLKKSFLGQNVKKLVLGNQRTEGFESSKEYKTERDWFIETYFSY